MFQAEENRHRQFDPITFLHEENYLPLKPAPNRVVVAVLTQPPDPAGDVHVLLRERRIRTAEAAASNDIRFGIQREQRPDRNTMTKKRMVLEIGMGTDIRGSDPTKAACRALRDALWHNSLSIAPALGHPLDAMIVDVHIGVPRPESVDKAAVMAVLPYGKGSVSVVEGGLEIHNDKGTDSTLIANACVVVSLDIA
jgi:uncharacterized protein (TIGR02058 family)